MAVGISKAAQNSKKKKSRKRNRIFEDSDSGSPFDSSRLAPKVLKRTEKRPTKREKRRQQREAQEFPGLSKRISEEARRLVPGEGILCFSEAPVKEDSDADSESNTATPSPEEQPPKNEFLDKSAGEKGAGESGAADSGFISLDMDDESTELGQRFVEYEEENMHFVNEFPCPWLGDADARPSASVGEQMSAEVLEFLRYMSPSKSEVKRRNDCINRLRRVVQQLWPNARVEVFGSYATGMYLPDADIDVVILGDEMRSKIRSEMYRLSARLKSNQIAASISVISHARVPIIKYVESGSGINVDIAFSQNGGLDTVARVSTWLNENKALKPMAMVVRQFLKRRNLSDVATGGLGGYATICMIYSRMQQRLQDMNGSDGALRNVGLLLLDFFNYYGHIFDNVGHYVRPRQAPRCTPCAKRLNGSMATPQAAGLAIEDPNDTSNNISKASYNYPTVKRSFGNAADYLKTLCLEWQRLPKSQRAEVSFLGPLLKPTGQEPRRFKVTLERALSVAKHEHSTSNRAEAPEPQPRQRAKPQSMQPNDKTGKDTRNHSPSPQASAVEKGKGVKSYDPWAEKSGSDKKETDSLGARKTQRPKSINKKQPEPSTTAKKRAAREGDSDDEDSRTKLTTAQRRQFWSRKAGSPETAQASN